MLPRAKHCARSRRLLIPFLTMRKLTIALVVLFSLFTLAQDKPAATSDEAPVRAVLDTQMTAWNKGDLEGYMSGYWNSPELVFIGGATETRGWRTTLERYRKAYQSAGREMGQLDFPEIRIQMLGPDAAYATGKFHLKMSDGKEPSGRFTVILRKFADGWKIVHDHSCS